MCDLIAVSGGFGFAASTWAGAGATGIGVADQEVTFTCTFEGDDFLGGFLDFALQFALLLLEFGVADGLEGVAARGGTFLKVGA